MDKIKKLPDTEFEIMKAVWDNEKPITTNKLMEAIGNEKGWKVPTVISFLNRLVDKGFIKTEKNGKERTYYPLIEKDEYLKFETSNFLKTYHGNSIFSFVSSLYDGKKLSDQDVQEILKIVEKGEK
ncbi:BlaI/MecI/CopY family transcriptional regulator [Clostridium oryzae]|uniref:Penicillinase repressor n=1 Tax=Clostridium oryzae TaxID=1450648 RepID=A0A1V4IWR5_9CLOT|nr:BlaI/MecI/CopY family transcriptional regulator [Clostridium oryzae]OPJ64225.1 penicillinase repressor [Clostridium oryzae]